MSPHCWGLETTLRHTILGRNPLDEWSTRNRGLYLATHSNHKRQTSVPRRDSNPQSQQVRARRPKTYTVRPPERRVYKVDTEETDHSSPRFEFGPVDVELVEDTVALWRLLGTSVSLVTIKSLLLQTRLQFKLLETVKHNRYTGCPRRNVRDFGRVFLMLNYTDITQNTYIQTWTVTEIMTREVWNFDSCYSLIDYQIHIETGRNVCFL